eukprot:1700394-Pleurochrysis_carterae.AAC.1
MCGEGKGTVGRRTEVVSRCWGRSATCKRVSTPSIIACARLSKKDVGACIGARAAGSYGVIPDGHSKQKMWEERWIYRSNSYSPKSGETLLSMYPGKTVSPKGVNI